MGGAVNGTGSLVVRADIGRPMGDDDIAPPGRRHQAGRRLKPHEKRARGLRISEPQERGGDDNRETAQDHTGYGQGLDNLIQVEKAADLRSDPRVGHREGRYQDQDDYQDARDGPVQERHEITDDEFGPRLGRRRR